VTGLNILKLFIYYFSCRIKAKVVDRRKEDRVIAVFLTAVLSLGTPRSKVYIPSASKDTSTSNRTQKFIKMFTTARH
jgi:hypothetical protein